MATASTASTGAAGVLAAPIERALGELVAAAQAALGSDLRSIVLYGSAADGQLRATSDVNAIVVLTAFDAGKLDGLREALRAAQAAFGLHVMFLLEREIDDAIAAFAVKFADVLRRRRVLFGGDPFAERKPSRAAELARLRQVLLNLVLRTRQQYLVRSLREEQCALIAAELAGPLRACAASVLELHGERVASPKHALASLAERLPGGPWAAALAGLSEARETRALPPGAGTSVVLALLALAEQMRAHVDALAAPASEPARVP